MQIRPTMPSFKGYIQVSARQKGEKNIAIAETRYTFNTNSIAFSDKNPYSLDSGSYIFHGDKVFQTHTPYNKLQEMVMMSDAHKEYIIALDNSGKIYGICQ